MDSFLILFLPVEECKDFVMQVNISTNICTAMAILTSLCSQNSVIKCYVRYCYYWYGRTVKYSKSNCSSSFDELEIYDQEMFDEVEKFIMEMNMKPGEVVQLGRITCNTDKLCHWSRTKKVDVITNVLRCHSYDPAELQIGTGLKLDCRGNLFYQFVTICMKENVVLNTPKSMMPVLIGIILGLIALAVILILIWFAAKKMRTIERGTSTRVQEATYEGLTWQSQQESEYRVIERPFVNEPSCKTESLSVTGTSSALYENIDFQSENVEK